jgi:tripartite-type tricarboxylate transporter receptor subunit TctC
MVLDFKLTPLFYVWYFDLQMLAEEKFNNCLRSSSRSKIRFFSLLALIALVLLGLDSSTLARESGYPKKHIDWIVTYTPGGGYDTYSRAIAKILPKYLPHRTKIVIKNVAGAGGRRGSAVLYRSKPDGYTLGMLNPMGLMTSDIVKKSKEYDISKYTYLATCVRGVPGIFVRSDSKFNSITDMQNADNVKFATSGRGSGTWLWGKLIAGLCGVRVHMVSGYLGTTEYITALLRKDVDAFTIGFTSSLIPYFKSGEIRPLLIFTEEKWDLVPQAHILKGTPFGELADFNNDRVIAGPPGLPEEILHILEASLLKTLNDPELKEWSKATHNPLYILNAEETIGSIKKTLDLVNRYKDYFKD